MPAIIAAAGIGAGTTLVSTGVQLWFNNRAQQEARKEHKRSEALQIKFAERETRREESRFKKQFGLQQAGQNFEMTQRIMQNLRNMFESNRANSQQMMSFNRRRRLA
jgi:hypothetical protein